MIASEDGFAPGHCLSSEEIALARLINAYRSRHGLSAIPLSRSLTQVAQWHVIDLQQHRPAQRKNSAGKPCTLHSWSDQGIWKPVCYTPDHASAAGMWNKPREITANRYSGNGYEIAYWNAKRVTASRAFTRWRESLLHREVILEQGGWAGRGWQAMGVGVSLHYAVVWFGERSDPQGEVFPCQAETPLPGEKGFETFPFPVR